MSSCWVAPARSCSATGPAHSTSASTVPRKQRVFQGMRVEEIDEEEARRRQRSSDRARIDYVKHFYRADARDPRHYHMVTRLDRDVAADVRRFDRTAARAQRLLGASLRSASVGPFRSASVPGAVAVLRGGRGADRV